MGNEKMVSGCVFKVLFQLDCESKEILSNGIVGKERCQWRLQSFSSFQVTSTKERDKKRLEV